MHDSDAVERRLSDAFANVTASAAVDTWRTRTPMPHGRRDVVRSRLFAMALAAGIAAALLAVSVAGTVALSHFHTAPSVGAHPSVAPVTTAPASPVPTTTTSLCSSLETPSTVYGFRFDAPGSATPAISCSQAIATLRCPPPFVSGATCIKSVGPITAQLVRVSTVETMGEVRGNGFPFAGTPFTASKLLVWRLTFEPTVCTVDSSGVSGSDLPPFYVFFAQASTRCREADDYLIDASTGDFVFYDNTRQP